MARRPQRRLDPAAVARLRDVADLLDTRWRLPGTNMRFGLDGVAGIIPGVGGTATGIVAAWIVWQAHRLGVPRGTLVRMLGNVGVDWVVGSIPVLGAVFDFAFKANARNMALLRAHLDAFDDREVERRRDAARR